MSNAVLWLAGVVVTSVMGACITGSPSATVAGASAGETGSSSSGGTVNSGSSGSLKSGSGFTSSATSSPAGTSGEGGTSGSGSGTGGGSTTGRPLHDCTGDGGCAHTAYQYTYLCESPSCNCGQVDTDDAFFRQGVCENSCGGDAGCQNAVTVCLNGSCVVNACSDDALPGDQCRSAGGANGFGTCIPSDGFHLDNICVPDGTATTCVIGQNNDSPVYPDVPIIKDPQPANPATFCGSGEGCYSPGAFCGESGTCEKLCSDARDGGDTACKSPARCIPQDPMNETWGFCLSCMASSSDGGSPGLCLRDADCCELNCSIGAGGVGLCLPGE